MISPGHIILLCWIIFLSYWIVSAREVKPAEEVAKNFGASKWWYYSGRIILPALLIIGLTDKVPVPFLSVRLFSQTQVVDDSAVFLMVIGLIIALVARKTLAANWSGNIEFKKDHELITSGVYHYMRHPIYTGIFCMGLGTFLFSGTVSTLTLFLIGVTFLIYKLKAEEKLLMKHFPETYASYRKKVKGLIPFIY